jgi:hypothetical protein
MFGIRGFFLHHVVRQRHGQTLFGQPQRLLAFGRRDQIRGAQLVVHSPASPVRQVFHRPPEVFFRRDGRASRALALCVS